MATTVDWTALEHLVRRLEASIEEGGVATICTRPLQKALPTQHPVSGDTAVQAGLLCHVDLDRFDAVATRLEQAAEVVLLKAGKEEGTKAPPSSTSLVEELQQRSLELRRVPAAQQRIAAVGCIDEPMDQICLTNDMERERSECWRHALYLGSFSSACMQDALAVRNIRTILSILHDAAPSLDPIPGVDYWRSPSIKDENNCTASQALATVLADVHARIDAGLLKGSVLVHCMMGVSRSGTAVTSYVMRKLGVGRDEALARVRQCRSVVRPNFSFDRLLGQLEHKYRTMPTASEVQALECKDHCDSQDAVAQAASAIRQADFLLLASGAGLSADSGLATFATMTQKLSAALGPGLSYDQAAGSDMMAKDPSLFYGFWFTSAHNYANAEPHEGYEILGQWRVLKERQSQSTGDVPPAFALTSNVDGFMKRIGFVPAETLAQIHGSIEKWQCGGVPSGSRFPLFRTERCSEDLFDQPPRDGTDYERLRYSRPPPLCPRCGEGWLRPHVYLFGDGRRFVDKEEETGQKAYTKWQQDVLNSLRANPAKRLAIVEIGCGLRVPNIRKRGEELLAACPAGQGDLIRINPELSEQHFAAKASIALQTTALKGLQQIHAELQRGASK